MTDNGIRPTKIRYLVPPWCGGDAVKILACWFFEKKNNCFFFGEKTREKSHKKKIEEDWSSMEFVLLNFKKSNYVDMDEIEHEGVEEEEKQTPGQIKRERQLKLL